MPYLLDANAVITLLENRSAGLARRVRQHAVSDIAISSIVLHELYFGAFKSRRVTENAHRVNALLFEVLEFDKEDARQAGEVRALLAGAGSPIGPYDVLIAGQAISRNRVVVTRNTREFARVPGLQIENWEA
jgi:tRNA(fMet)-specific endonuclease VapC